MFETEIETWFGLYCSFWWMEVPCVFKKNVYSALVRWHILLMSHRSKWTDSVIWVFHICMTFLSTCSINYWEGSVEIYKYSIYLSISSFSSVRFCSVSFEALLLDTHSLNIITSFNKLTHLSLLNVFLYFSNILFLLHFVWY